MRRAAALSLAAMLAVAACSSGSELDSIVSDACADSTYTGCEDGLRQVAELLPGQLVAICEYEDDQGDIVLIDRIEDAEARCSGDGAYTVSRVAGVLTVPEAE